MMNRELTVEELELVNGGMVVPVTNTKQFEDEPCGASGTWDEDTADVPWYKKIFNFLF